MQSEDTVTYPIHRVFLSEDGCSLPTLGVLYELPNGTAKYHRVGSVEKTVYFIDGGREEIVFGPEKEENWQPYFEKPIRYRPVKHIYLRRGQ